MWKIYNSNFIFYIIIFNKSFLYKSSIYLYFIPEIEHMHLSHVTEPDFKILQFLWIRSNDFYCWYNKQNSNSINFIQSSVKWLIDLPRITFCWYVNLHNTQLLFFNINLPSFWLSQWMHIWIHSKLLTSETNKRELNVEYLLQYARAVLIKFRCAVELIYTNALSDFD